MVSLRFHTPNPTSSTETADPEITVGPFPSVRLVYDVLRANLDIPAAVASWDGEYWCVFDPEAREVSGGRVVASHSDVDFIFHGGGAR